MATLLFPLLKNLSKKYQLKAFRKGFFHLYASIHLNETFSISSTPLTECSSISFRLLMNDDVCFFYHQKFIIFFK